MPVEEAFALGRFFRSARKDRNGRPVVRASHGTWRQRDGLEAVEGKRFVTPGQIGVAASAIDATVAGLAVVVLGRSS